LLSAFLCSLTAAAFALSSARFQHWFVIPLILCGILAGTDAIEWFRGKLDLYDPIGILGAFSVHFFFLAPLLHIQVGEFLSVTPPPDWRDWFGAMGILNALGLIAYRICRGVFKRRRPEPTKSYWTFDGPMLRLIGPAVLFVTFVAQLAVYAKFGGGGGYVETRLNNPTAFTGMGWMFMVSESFPIVAALLGIAYARQHKVGWAKIAFGLFIIFLLLMFFGGLRGSRSNTVLALFWIVGTIHFLVRPVPRKMVCAGLAFLFVFMYVYGFYKEGGLRAFSGSQAREQIAQKHGRTFTGMLLGDLGRADVQAYILYKLINYSSDLTYAWGRTYLGGLSIVIPHSIYPDRPETIFREGTEVLGGSGSYVPDVVQSSKVFGLAGEAMLNFGPISVPIIYGLFGLFVAWFRMAIQRLAPGDARLFFVPFGIFLCVNALGSDSDELVFGIFKFNLVAALIVWVCTTKVQQYSWLKTRANAILLQNRPAERV
jgi:hypothetical protein